MLSLPQVFRSLASIPRQPSLANRRYREIGAAFWRGITFDDTANQLCSNGLDPAKGRQLPLHIGDREKHFFYVKSTLGSAACASVSGQPSLARLLPTRRVEPRSLHGRVGTQARTARTRLASGTR